MAEQSPVFRGMIRPPKLMELPVMFFMVWLFGSTLLFVWLQHWIVLFISGGLYAALWAGARWDEAFMDVFVTTLQETPPTPNRKIHGGDSYAP